MTKTSTTTQLMAIINCTPDSFYSESRFFDHQVAIDQALKMIDQGADIIDIGGESTRPKGSHGKGACLVTIEEELDRVITVIQELSKLSATPISIDTYKPVVAKQAIAAGATIVNDVSGCSNQVMCELIADSGCKICIMHSKGDTQSMQNNPQYPYGVVEEIKNFLEEKIKNLLAIGVKEEQIIVDPGIGFGKSVAHNVEIVQNLQKIKSLGFPVLFGASRKTFIRKILNKSTSELLNGTLAVNAIATAAGVDILRVHDVAEHRDLIDIIGGMNNIMQKQEKELEKV